MHKPDEGIFYLSALKQLAPPLKLKAARGRTCFAKALPEGKAIKGK